MSEKISLKKMPSKAEKIGTVQKPYYPSFYVDKKLPIGKEMVGKKVLVKATLYLSNYGDSVSDDNNEVNYRFDILDIQFLNGAVEAVKSILSKKES